MVATLCYERSVTPHTLQVGPGFYCFIVAWSSCCRYIPVLMQQAKIYWDMENFPQVEKIFRKSVEFCNEHDVWKLNVAHVLFMQENKFKEATGFYEPIVKKHYDNVSLAYLLWFVSQTVLFDSELFPGIWMKSF